MDIKTGDRIVIDGVKLIAVPAENFSCEGCYFYKGKEMTCFDKDSAVCFNGEMFFILKQVK